MGLFKYLPPERVDVLSNLAIRFTPPSEFNDPFESHQATVFEIDGSFIDEMLVRARKTIPRLAESSQEAGDFSKFVRELHANPTAQSQELRDRTEAWGKAQTQATFQRAYERIGILSLSMVENHPLMWAHYASGHRGFVIEFEQEDDFFTKSPSLEPYPLEFPKEVQYAKTRMVVNAAKPAGDELLRDVVLTKAETWSYEQEVRMVRDLRQSNVPGPSNVPLFKIPESAFKRVIFGCKAGKRLRGKFLEIKKANPNFSHLQFYEVHLHPTEYALVMNIVQEN